jgi:type VI secretion system secreted protein Hcp
MKIEGMPGEVTKTGHEQWIEILSYSWGMHKPGVLDSDQEWKILKALDKSSPKLFDALQRGSNINSLQIELVDQTSGIVFMKYTFTNVLISSMDIGPSILKEWDASSPKLMNNVRPIEEVSFNFQKIHMTYTPPSATTQGSAEWGWDFLGKILN